MSIKIVHCGIPRSGSTLTWQILQDLFPEQKIFKTHPAAWELDGESFLFSTIRHPYDVVSSRFRIRIVRTEPHFLTEVDEEAWLDLLIREGEDELRTRVRADIRSHRDYVAGPPGLGAEIADALSHFRPLFDMVEGNKKSLVLRYEEFWNDFEVVFNAIEDSLCRCVTLEEREDLTQKYNAQGNWKRAVFDQTRDQLLHHHIHPGHLGSVEPGQWKRIIPEWGWEMVIEALSPICDIWNYPKEWPE